MPFRTALKEGWASHRFQIVHALVMDPVSFVKSLDLGPYSGGFHGRSGRFRGSGPITADNKKEGFVDAASLASFVSNLKGQQKDDVLCSTLLAQLVAFKEYEDSSQLSEWYKLYANVMGNIGWVMQDMVFEEYKSSSTRFKIADVVVEILSELVGPSEELVKLVKATIMALKDNEDGLKLFGSKSTQKKKPIFQLLPCTVDKTNNQVNVAFIGCYVEVSGDAENYFFFDYTEEDIQLWYSRHVFTLNETVYAQVREEVIKKLGNSRLEYIKNLPAVN